MTFRFDEAAADHSLQAEIARMLRVDDAGSAVVLAAIKQHYLAAVAPVAIDSEAMRMFPIWGGDQRAQTEIKVIDWEQYGSARAINNSATDLPSADIGAVTRIAYLKQFGNFFGFSTMELEAALYQGIPLDSLKHRAAASAHGETVNDLFWEGNASLGVTGFANHPFTTAVLPADGTGSSASWKSKTAVQIARDMAIICESISRRTNGATKATRLLLSIDAFDIARSKLVENTDVSALALFRRDNQGVTVEEVYSMSTRGNVDALAVAGNDAIGLWLPMFALRHASQQDGLVLKTILETRSAGLVVRENRKLTAARDLTK